MKDFVLNDGKNYISARRASQITGYNPDYISQLCRKGILDSCMVGRSWFVSEDALKIYKETPLTHKPKSESQEVRPEVVRGTRAERMNAQQTSYFMERFGGKPLISPEHAVAFLSPNQDPAQPIVVQSNRAFLNTIGVGVALVVLLILATSNAVNLEKYARGDSNKSTASVIESVGSSIGNKAKDAIEAISSVRVEDVRGAFLGVGVDQAVVVLPATGHSSTDRQITQYVKNSFSDEVIVERDETGTSGIIRPVFRSGDDQEYLYVTAPMLR
jgi:hypothetical protein